MVASSFPQRTPQVLRLQRLLGHAQQLRVDAGDGRGEVAVHDPREQEQHRQRQPERQAEHRQVRRLLPGAVGALHQRPARRRKLVGVVGELPSAAAAPTVKTLCPPPRSSMVMPSSSAARSTRSRAPLSQKARQGPQVFAQVRARPLLHGEDRERVGEDRALVAVGVRQAAVKGARLGQVLPEPRADGLHVAVLLSRPKLKYVPSGGRIAMPTMSWLMSIRE